MLLLSTGRVKTNFKISGIYSEAVVQGAPAEPSDMRALTFAFKLLKKGRFMLSRFLTVNFQSSDYLCSVCVIIGVYDD